MNFLRVPFLEPYMLTKVFVLKELVGYMTYISKKFIPWWWRAPSFERWCHVFKIRVSRRAIWNLTECVSEHQTNQTYWRHFHNSYEWWCYILWWSSSSWWWCCWWWIYFCIWWYLGGGVPLPTHAHKHRYEEKLPKKYMYKDFCGE